MREDIFEIFKALRHFNVSADEIDNIRDAYKFWINRPIDFVQTYRKVYYHNGVLYALPYPLAELKNEFVGIELNGVIYLAGYLCNVRQEKIAQSLLWLKGKIFCNHPYTHYGTEMPNSLTMTLPTGKEILDLISNTQESKDLDSIVFNKNSNFWVTPEPMHPDEIVATALWRSSVTSHCPTEKEEAHIQPIIRMRTGLDFIGHLNDFGVPDQETSEVYGKLLASAETLKH